MGKQHVLAMELPTTVYYPNGTSIETVYRPIEDDYQKMGVAIEMAKLALSQGDNPVGAVLSTPFGDFPAETREFRDHDSEAHAEKRSYRMAIEAARENEADNPRLAQEPFGLHLGGCRLFSTAELCVGCAHLYDQVEISMVFIAANRDDAPDFFRKKDIDMRAIWQQSPRTLAVVEGLRRVEALELLTANTKRHK